MGLQGIQASTETATMILRIDDAIAAKTSKSPERPPGGLGGSFGGDMEEEY